MMTDLPLRSYSRRGFLGSATAVAAAHSFLGSLFIQSIRAAETRKCRAYVGTYTASVDGAAHGEGIYRFDVDTVTGELSNPKLAAKTPNPSWIAIHPSRSYLYAINEVTDFDGGNGSVSSFAIDSASGDLTLLNTVSSAGAGPAHMSLDRTGKFAFVANYMGGSVAVLPILADGRLAAAVDVHRDQGPVGSTHAFAAPPGSFAISGHDTPHAHMIAADPRNKFVLAIDLGQDKIYVYGFDQQTGKLTLENNIVSLPSGSGPRHFAFHPNGVWLYVLAEESSTIVFFQYDPQTGTLTGKQIARALPPRFAGTSFGSEIQVSPDGKFVMSANRLHDTISVGSIGSDGTLDLIGEVSTMGDYPRHFGFDPTGNFLYVCDQKSDCITSFSFQRETGLLTFTGQYAAVGSPAMIAFLA